MRSVRTAENSGAWAAAEMAENQELEQYIADLESHIGSFVRKTISDAPVAPIPLPDLVAN
jgi:hypothetical protein